MNPLFFGSSNRQLFGVHHPPEGMELRDGAVLLCPPFGHEYIAAHRPLQQLAVRLARAGCHVLRFDLYGCGDSAGDMEDATFAQWLDDVATAAQELRDTSGSRRLCLVGLRLGGTLAALAGAAAVAAGARDAFASVLWEPVINGAQYIAELQAAQRDWVRRTFPKPKPETLDWPVPEVLGYPLPEPLQDELRAVDLLRLPRPPAQRVLLVQTRPSPQAEALRAHLAGVTASAGDVTHELVEHEPCWEGHRGGTIALVPVEVNQAITRWVVESYS
jgi:pimeloyl-ACP methyl ester carboxylesterase